MEGQVVATLFLHSSVTLDGLQPKRDHHNMTDPNRPYVIFDEHPGYVTLTLDRPESRNPLSEAMLAALIDGTDWS